jgi:hypothetical protein
MQPQANAIICAFIVVLQPVPHPRSHHRYIGERMRYQLAGCHIVDPIEGSFSSSRQRCVQSQLPIILHNLTCLLCEQESSASLTTIGWLLSILAERCGDGMGVGRQHQHNQSINALVDISTRIHHHVNDRSMVVFRA